MISDPDVIIRRMVDMAGMIPKYRTTDPVTSKVAAQRVAQYSDSQAVKVLFWIWSAEPYGKTYWEVESEIGMRSADKRMGDLKNAGLIQGTGDTRITAFGSPAEVCRVTDKVVGQTGQGYQYGMLL
jgi:hypothetical protein